jgi:hypothetical protein
MLVETLVYLILMVVLSGALVTTYLSLDTVLVRNATERTLNRSAVVALERIERSIRSAESINNAQSAFDTANGVLALTEVSTSTRFLVTSGALIVEVNGVSLGRLTESDVVVDSLRFNKYIASTTEMVRVSLTLSVLGKTGSSTRTYYDSAVIRGSYE